MNQYLLLATLILIICVLGNKLSNRIGVPMLLAFILLGMLFGSDGLIKIPFDNYAFAEQICSVALIFIMFYGGFGTNWREARPVAAPAIVLASLGVVLTALFVGVFCHFVLGVGWLESFLLGSVISSTDAASVFSIFRSWKLNLRDRTASLLELESGSNDPTSYMLTMVVLTLMEGEANAGIFAYLLFSQVVYGLLFGAAIAVLSVKVMTHFDFGSDGFDSIFVLAMAIFAYAAPSLVGGNGYLSTYVVGIVLGNSPLKNKKTLVHFFDGMTGLMQIVIFFLLGLLCFPSKIPQVIIPAILIALFLTFVARPLAVAGILTPFRCRWQQQAVVAWCGLRGAASIVFAIMVTVSSVELEFDIFHVVFGIVLLSILFQGSLTPVISRRLGMIDDNSNVMKTFTDYSEEVPVEFIHFKIRSGHPWCDQPLHDIMFPPETLAVLILRGKERIVPNGDTVLEQGDKLVLSAKSAGYLGEICLTEITVNAGSQWVEQPVSLLDVGPDKLIIMVQRGENVIIPRGDTMLLPGDLLVINESS
mgnify:CR=1 FL=1